MGEGYASLNKENPYLGSSLDDLLNEEGILGAVQAEAESRVLAWRRKGLTRRAAARCDTCRRQLRRATSLLMVFR